MTDEQQHDFTFTTSEVAKLNAVQGVGFAILNNPKLAYALAAKLPGFATSLMMAHALLSNQTMEEWGATSTEDSTMKVMRGISDAKEIARQFLDIVVEHYADEKSREEYQMEKNRPPTYDPDVS